MLLGNLDVRMKKPLACPNRLFGSAYFYFVEITAAKWHRGMALNLTRDSQGLRYLYAAGYKAFVLNY